MREMRQFKKNGVLMWGIFENDLLVDSWPAVEYAKKEEKQKNKREEKQKKWWEED